MPLFFDTINHMESLINFLDAYNPEPRYAQIANGGNWEDAVRIDFVTDASYDVSSLGEVDASIAGEVFYKLNDGRVILFCLWKFCILLFLPI